jgi:hypothetical protein
MTDREAQLRSELEDLIDADGRIFAADVVDFAVRNPGSELHRRFQWDQAKAAYQHWLHTARHLIAVYVLDVRGERRTISLTTDRVNGGGYRERDDVLSSAEMRRQAVQDAIAEITRWRDRNNHLHELAEIFAAIDRATTGPPPAQTRRMRRLTPPEERPSA